MRTVYHEQLADLNRTLGDMCELTGATMEHATQALLQADLGVASGNGKGQIFVRGEVIKTVPESQIVETLIEEALRIAEESGDTGPGAPVVSVS